MHSDISVYVTCYNQEAYIHDTLESVYKQTLLPHEIIVIDDASSDGSQKVITKSIQSSPVSVRFIQNNENLGIVSNRNLAKKVFTGDYLVGLDGDDIWFPSKLELEKKAVSSLDADFSFSWHQRFFKIQDLKNTDCEETKRSRVINDLGQRVLLRKYGPSLFRSELVSRRALDVTGDYDTQLVLYEDYDYKIRLSQKFKGAEVFAVTQGYRDNPSGLSKMDVFEHYKALHRIYAKYLGNNKPLCTSENKNYFYLKLESLLLKAFKNKEISICDYYREINRLRIYKTALVQLIKSYLIPFKIWKKRI